MQEIRDIHPQFEEHLKHKRQELIDLYTDLRAFVLFSFPDCNELLYHTHALTSVYTVSEKMSDGFCMIPIYTDHLNLGFNKGTLLDDPNQLLNGTGKLIRHIPIHTIEDYRNDKVKELFDSAVAIALEDRDNSGNQRGKTISKIKQSK